MAASCRKLTLLLTDRCNLSCAYCYQGQKRPGRARMTWTTAKAALDFMLANAPRPFSVEFSGGEPLLAPDLLIRCVDYVASKRADEDSISLGIITNGTLLTSGLVDHLVARDVKLRLSFDGPADVQEHRGKGTFHRLDGLLDEIQVRHPDWFTARFRVNAVLHSHSLRAWADSARYFLAKSVPEILFYPAIGGTGRWSSHHLRLLEDQAEEIAEESVRHWERADSVPVLFLRPHAPAASKQRDDGGFCGAAEGAGICVDTDGMVWSCPFFAGSSSAESPLRDQAASALLLGGVRDVGLLENLAALPDRASRLPLMTRRREKFSSYGRCGDCEFLSECFLCPAAISHHHGNMDPDKVSDFFCAHMQATSRARRAFRERTGEKALERYRGRVNEALRDLRLELEKGFKEVRTKRA